MLETKKAITLTELLVATVLIGIVSLGIMAFSISIKGIRETTQKTTALNMEIIAAMTNIKRDAALAVGDRHNPGILVETTNPVTNDWIAFRQDRNTPPTPGDYTDDVWVIYVRNLATNLLYSCVSSSSPPPVCTVGSASAVVLSSSIENATFQVVQSDSTSELNVNVMIHARFKAGSPPSAGDDIHDPEYILTAQINAAGHSW